MKMNRQMAGRIGAIRRNSLYGNPATQEGRRRGGQIAYSKMQLQASPQAKTGFKFEKTIVTPELNSYLAEFIGIVLGDGSVNDYQIKIYFNSKTDAAYARRVKGMIRDLFNLESTVSERCKNTLELVVSSTALVKFLVSVGLKAGNKIENQIDVPAWILDDSQCLLSCLRGLMDTDGGIYSHTHTTKGIVYRNIALCFTNRSRPLLKRVEQALLMLGIHAKNNLVERVRVYNRTDIARYMELVGSHNQNFLNRYNAYKS